MPVRWKLGALVKNIANTIRESGGAILPIGAVADGQVLRRSGTTCVGLTLPFTQEFISSDQTVTINSVLNVAHGFGVKPKLVQVALKCATAEFNYSVGDEVILYGIVVEVNAGGHGIEVVTDTTNVTVLTATVLDLKDKATPGTTVTITVANWKYVIRAWA